MNRPTIVVAELRHGDTTTEFFAIARAFREAQKPTRLAWGIDQLGKPAIHLISTIE